jgi:hypothetical protein
LKETEAFEAIYFPLKLALAEKYRLIIPLELIPIS